MDWNILPRSQLLGSLRTDSQGMEVQAKNFTWRQRAQGGRFHIGKWIQYSKQVNRGTKAE